MARSPVTRLGEEPESQRRGGASLAEHREGVPGACVPIIQEAKSPGNRAIGESEEASTTASANKPGGWRDRRGQRTLPTAFTLPGPSPAGAPAAGPARLTQGWLSDHHDAPTPPRVTAGLTRDRAWHSRPGPTTSRARVHGADPMAGATCSPGSRTVGPVGRGTGEGRKREAGDTRMASLRGVLVQKEACEGTDGARGPKGESGFGSEDAEHQGERSAPSPGCRLRPVLEQSPNSQRVIFVPRND